MEAPLPFSQRILEDGEIIRTFSKDALLEELQWHQDERDRWVTPLHDTDWQVQMEDELPQSMVRGERVFINAGRWHRVLRGTGDLTVAIREL